MSQSIPPRSASVPTDVNPYFQKIGGLLQFFEDRRPGFGLSSPAITVLQVSESVDRTDQANVMRRQRNPSGVLVA